MFCHHLLNVYRMTNTIQRLLTHGWFLTVGCLFHAFDLIAILFEKGENIFPCFTRLICFGTTSDVWMRWFPFVPLERLVGTPSFDLESTACIDFCDFMDNSLWAPSQASSVAAQNTCTSIRMHRFHISAARYRVVSSKTPNDRTDWVGCRIPLPSSFPPQVPFHITPFHFQLPLK